MAKSSSNRRTRDDVAQTVADITGKSPRLVNMVRNGERENETIELVTVEYTIGRNKLIEYLRELEPLTKNTTRHGRKKN